MALGDGIRRNIAHVEPEERALLRDAFLGLQQRHFAGARDDDVPGGVTLWFKQDEIHQATHVHHGPEFLPWHREIVNRMEQMLRHVHPQVSLHYWNWQQHPGKVPDGNIGGGTTGELNLFTADFMGHGDEHLQPIGPPWQNEVAPFRSDGFYLQTASADRDSSGNPADPPLKCVRRVAGSPASPDEDRSTVTATDYPTMRKRLERTHDNMHNFVAMGGQHISFRDPFVFLLHSNVDRLFALWQTQPGHPERLDPDTVYGPESDLDVPVESSVQNLTHRIEPWSTGRSFDQFGVEHRTRPWFAPEGEGRARTYRHPSIVRPPRYVHPPTDG